MPKHYDATQALYILKQITVACMDDRIGLTVAAYLETKEKKTPRPSIRLTCSRLFTDEDIINICAALNNALNKVVGL